MYMYYNILLAPTIAHTPLSAIIFVLLGCLSAIATSLTLFYLIFKDRKSMDNITKLLYVFIGISFMYAAAIYGLATAGIFSIPTYATMIPPSYGNYLRPVLTFLLLSPGLVAIKCRRTR